MAAPTYTTDLKTFDLIEAASTIGEFTGMADGGSPDDSDTDDIIQGSYHASALCSLKVGELQSIYVDYGSGATIGTDDAVFMWFKFDAGGILDSYDNGGVRAVMGQSATNWDAWKAGGVDRIPNPAGGWHNYALNPTARTYDYRGGTGTGTSYRYGGMAIDVTAVGPSKGQPFKLDGLRFGRGTLKFEYGDSSNGYANFASAATKNDANNATDGYNRWGLFSAYGGGYLWKGEMALGTTTNAVEFVDSDAFILVDDTVNCSKNFNQITIEHTDSVIEWTNVIFKSLGTTSPGRLVQNADADFTLNECQFFDLGTFFFGASTTLNGGLFQGCNSVYQEDALFDGTTFNQSSAATAALFATDIGELDNCTFTMGASIHAFELATAHAGNSYTLTNITFEGYNASDEEDDSAIYNNSGGAVTITISGGTTPSIKNGAGASTQIVANAVNVTLIAQTATGTKIQDANAFLTPSTSTGPFPYLDTVTIQNHATACTVSHTAHNMATNDEIWIQGASHSQNNGVHSITKVDADSYTYSLASDPGSDPTGTITATMVFLKGLTDSNGEITMSKTFSADQEAIGWARKSSSSPLYKTGPVSGNIDKDVDTTFTAILSPDE